MLVFQMHNVDKTSTALKQTKNSDYADKQIQKLNDLFVILVICLKSHKISHW